MAGELIAGPPGAALPPREAEAAAGTAEARRREFTTVR